MAQTGDTAAYSGQKGGSNDQFGRLLTNDEFSKYMGLMLQNKDFSSLYNIVVNNGYKLVQEVRAPGDPGLTDSSNKTMSIDPSQLSRLQNGKIAPQEFKDLVLHEFRHAWQYTMLEQKGSVTLTTSSYGTRGWSQGGIGWNNLINAWHPEKKAVEQDAMNYASRISSQMAREVLWQ